MLQQQKYQKTGIQHIGENRVGKFSEKYQALKEYDLTCTWLGAQRRKVKDVINLKSITFHAFDSRAAWKRFKKRAEHPIKYFSKWTFLVKKGGHGFAPDELDDV